jgi:hypothetical protein
MTVDTSDSSGPAEARYTHRDWKHETGEVLLVVAAVVQALHQMEASGAEVHAGNTHMAHIRRCLTQGIEVLKYGMDLVDDTDARYLPVAEAIAAAGGASEVAHAKTYHQT